ncbi:hypothetical protein HZA44_03035 [Candidatus Peregrinibacteria bacterium]|nr:hypothetical protein [Candidatus Peregrinibacteria bacterium]
MKNGQQTEKRSVHFGQESYSQVIQAIKRLGKALLWSRLNRTEGIVSLEVVKGTPLEEFNDIKGGEKLSHDRRLKVSITPLTPADGDKLQPIFMLSIGDFAKDIVQVDFRKDTYLSILFGNLKAKEKFLKVIRETEIPKTDSDNPEDPSELYSASVTIKA